MTGKIKKKLFIIGLVAVVVLGVFLIRGLFTHKQWIESSTLEELKSLPYAGWSEEAADQSKASVVKYDAAKAFNGYNLLVEVDRAFLINMDGKVVHTWHFPFRRSWAYALLEDNGDLIGMDMWHGYVKLDWFSNVIWFIEMTSHHDIEKLPDGTYLILDKYLKPYKSYQNVYFDVIKHVSEDGKLLDQWSTFDHLDEIQKYHDPIALDQLARDSNINQEIAEFDYYHLNTIKVLPKNPLGKDDKRFQQGNWLTCLRNANLIVILDKDTKEIVWHWGIDEVDWPHMPYMLDNGDILIFDNGTHRKDRRGRRYSRVIQVNPVNYKITWEYKADPPHEFFSSYRGSAQRLPNGNTLITEADKGHVFEVEEQGETVWDFYNPEFNANNRRRVLYRMLRYPQKTVKKLMRRNSIKRYLRHYLGRENNIKNGSFEESYAFSYNKPSSWFTEYLIDDKKTFIWDSTCAKSGDKCIMIHNTVPNDSRWLQGIRVKPQTEYKLTGWIKTENVQVRIAGKLYSKDSPGNAYLSIEHFNRRSLECSNTVSGTCDWTPIILQFKTEDEEWIYLHARLGTNGILAQGKAWYDDIMLEEIN